MRRLDDLRGSWQAFLQHTSLEALRTAVRSDGTGAASPNALRSAYWRAFLFFQSTEYHTWATSLAAARSAYDALHARFHSAPGTEAFADDPLADGAESRWLAVQEDENLRAEILQDIVRLPDDEFLRRSDTQKTMLNILFVFCKLNPDLSYRQGMHELLAPLLVVIEQDALQVGDDEKIEDNDELLATVFDAAHIEHDAFTLFSRMMQNAKNFYEHTSHRAAENPLIVRSKRITDELLGQADPELTRHLEALSIPPQLFLMRWLRLLFGREFPRHDVLAMWDIIFAEDVTMELVDYICVIMLLCIRWDLLAADYNSALSLLLRYNAGEIKAQSLAIDALELRDRLTPSTGRRLIAKYTGRSPLVGRRRSGTPPAMQRNVTAFSGVNALKSAWRGAVEQRQGRETGEQSSGLETLLQNTARNILERGEQLGVGKAVRTAVDDIHRRAQQLRDADGPSTPPRHLRSPRSGRSAQLRLTELERRNKQLAVMLEHATDCLWDIQKQLAEAATSSPALNLEEMSIAVGKVQFVQLHLQDPTLRLSNVPMADASEPDVMDGGEPKPKAAASDPLKSPPQHAIQGELAIPADVALINDSPRTESDRDSKSAVTAASEAEQTTHADVATQPSKLDSLQSARPLLAESAYSWMLGQEEEKTRSAGRQQRPQTLFGK